MNNRRNIAILFFTMVVVMIGFGIMIPIMPFYVESFGASGSALGALMAIFSVMQFIFAPIWGSLSDRIGRKPVLLIGALGNALTQLLFGLSSQLWMLFAARALAGILSSATLPTAMAFIGDSTSEEDRGGGMGVIGAAMGVGMVLGPGLGGWMGGSSLSAPFFLAAALSLVALILILAVLPESLPHDQRVRHTGGLGGPSLRLMWKELFGPMGFLLFLAFLVNFALTNFEGIFGLYASLAYDYGPQQVGTIMTVIGLISAVLQGLVSGPATRRWGEVALIKASLAASVVGFVIMLLAYDFTTVLLTVGFFVTSNALLRPSISSLISRQAQTQGMAMGLNNGFQSLGRVIGPLWAGFMIDAHTSLPYTTGAAIMLVSFLLSLVLMRTRAAPKAAVEPQAGLD